MRRFWSTADMPDAPGLVPFSANLKLRYDASTETAYSDNDDASSLTDFSGQSNNASPLSGYDAPIFKTGIMNGLPVFRFNGSSSMMVSATNSFTNIYSQHQTIAIAYIPRGSGSAKRFFSSGANSGEYCVYMARSEYSSYNYPEAAAGRAQVGQDGAISAVEVDDGIPVIAIGVWDGSNVKYYQNGTLQDTTNFTGTTTGAISNTRPWGIGGQLVNGGSDLPSQVDIGEIAVWNDDFSGTDLDEITSYFTDKWNP